MRADSWRPAELVDVVENQDDVFVELLVEGLGKRVSERIGGPAPRTALSASPGVARR